MDQELDIAWVKDGVSGIAEVKNATNLFKSSDYDDVAALASRIRPDVVLIAAPEGRDEDLVKGKKTIEEAVGIKSEVWAWGPEHFKKSTRLARF